MGQLHRYKIFHGDLFVGVIFAQDETSARHLALVQYGVPPVGKDLSVVADSFNYRTK